MAKNLMQQLWKDKYATPDNIDTIANSQISKVSNFYHNQIVTFEFARMKIKRVFINTENKGVIYLE